MKPRAGTSTSDDRGRGTHRGSVDRDGEPCDPHPDKVAKSTRQRVNQAIAITGYTTNAMARSLRMGRSNMILILAPDIGDPNFHRPSLAWKTRRARMATAS